MTFPISRPRRLRRNEAVRRLVRETHLTTDGLVMPYFVVHGEGVKSEIQSMPGNFHLSPDKLVEEVRKTASLGVPAVLLFGLPAAKDPLGSEAYAEDGIVQQAVRRLKQACPKTLVIADVCMCEYTSHGHCGELVPATGGDSEFVVDNDRTLGLLERTSVSLARAGVDVIAPSDMMDGRVGAIRKALDGAGFTDIAIMSYAAKYASAFYGPFRTAADSAPASGDRKSYQMDPSNVREALREVELDLAEGADFIMVKPALSYLDVIRAVRSEIQGPVAAYNFSGEYSMVKAAAARGWIDEKRVVLEIATSIRRAGADILITYHANDLAEWIHG
jgi:porphobilinogen synthase